MEPIRNFNQLTAHLQKLNQPKRLVVVCGSDAPTEYAIHRAQEEGLVTIIRVDREDADEASREAVRLIREGEGDILMKGLVNTDNLLHAILDKETGLLPKGAVMTHLAVMQLEAYDKLLFFSDAAVIPTPTFQQRSEMIQYAIHACHRFGIAQPRIALIHCTEKVSPKFPHSLDYVSLIEHAEAGEFGNAIIDGPMDVKTACERQSGEIKGIVSPIDGGADVLIFPNIESGNVFYKTTSLFCHADMAGVLQGTICPVVLPSRSDSGLSKYYSIAMACLTGNLSPRY